MMKKSLSFSLLLTLQLISAPTGFQLVQGDAQSPRIDGNGQMVIESGKHAIIHWDSFSIDQQEAVRFLQQDAKSAVLNRVTGLSQSSIDGLLFSNGQVFLINPNGVLIGPNGKIVTSGFLGSTLDLLNEDFLKGAELSFRGNSDRAIVNLGTIEATDWNVFLLAGKIQNQGSVIAKQGTVGFGVGSEILLQPKGQNRIFIKCGLENALDSEVLLDQSGLIEAMNVELQSETRPYAKAIRVLGTVNSYSVQEDGGRVYLLADGGENEIQGTILAKSGSKGGQIYLLGKDVNICADATIDASGESGGGEILIGGDFGGKNPAILNAENTFLSQNAQVLAKATQDGDGGNVSFWGNQRLDVYGEINTEAGPLGGNGGELEISSSGILAMNGQVKQGAPRGRPGHTLYDPIDITISTSADSNVTNPGGAGTYTFPPGCGSTTSNIDSTSLSTNLSSGNVTINTSASGGAACGGTGNITIANDIVVDPGNLTLIADGGITINTGVLIGGLGAISFQTNSGDLQLNNASVTTKGITLNIAGNVSVTATSSGSKGLKSTQGISGSIGGSLSISASGTSGLAIFGGDLLNPVTANISVTVGTNVSLSATANSSQAIIGCNSTDVYIGDITITAGGNVSMSGNRGKMRIGHSTSFGQGTITVTAGGNITATTSGVNANAIFGHEGSLLASSPMTLIANGSISLTASTGSASVQLPTSDSTITLVCDNANPAVINPASTAGISFSGNATLESGSGNTVTAVQLYSIDPSLNTLPDTINSDTANFPPPAGQESLYEQYGVFYPGGTYGGQAYMNFYKTPPAPTPSPAPSPTPTPTTPTVDVIQVTTVTSTTAISNILTPSAVNNENNTSVIQGPSSETTTNPNDAINQNSSFNNDYTSTQACP